MKGNRSKAWREFCDGNVELLINHSKVVSLAFEAGYIAAKSEKSKGQDAVYLQRIIDDIDNFVKMAEQQGKKKEDEK